MGKPIAFITGASQGIGAGIALEMSKAGYDVAISYKSNRDKAMGVKADMEAYGAKTAVIHGDISSLADIDRMFEEFFASFDHVDVMVNNAGVTLVSPFLEATPEIFETLTNTDWRGSYFCSQKAARNMVDKGVKGTIINITSVHQAGCWQDASIYGPTKAALNKFTQHAAMELAPYGIRVVSIAPGYTLVRELTPRWQECHDNLNKHIPLGRFGEPREIGKACVFLSGEGGAYITGTCIYMDGGALLPVASDII